MSAVGRKQTFNSAVFVPSERPLLIKADIHILASGTSLLNVRFTPESGHWSNIAANDR